MSTFSRVFIDNIKSQVYESYKDGYVHPEFKPYDRPLKSTPTGLRFRLMHPDDPCMAGFTKDSTGMCTMPPSDGKATMYSPPADQYWNPMPLKQVQSFTNSFDNRSVDPFTGNHKIFYRSKTAASTRKYNALGTSKETFFA